MHTIAMVSRKGGTGKSTIAVGLAVTAMEAGHSVCVIEADPLSRSRIGAAAASPQGPRSRPFMTGMRFFIAFKSSRAVE